MNSNIARGVISGLLLLVGYKVVESASEQSYEKLSHEVPRPRSLETDAVFDRDVEWRRRLCALDNFCTNELRQHDVAAQWSVALIDACARMVRLRNAMLEAGHVAMPPTLSTAARICYLRIYECITAIEHVVNETCATLLNAPSAQEAARLIGSIAQHEAEQGAVVSAMPRDIMDTFKRFITLASEIKEVADNELSSIDRLRSLRLADGTQFSYTVPDVLLQTLQDALVLEHVISPTHHET